MKTKNQCKAETTKNFMMTESEEKAEVTEPTESTITTEFEERTVVTEPAESTITTEFEERTVVTESAEHTIKTEIAESIVQADHEVVAVNRNFKDTIFRTLFREKEILLQLYNAVNNTHYTQTDQLEIVTLENAIYMNFKNDLAFLVDFQLHLYEHQATVNPNMPLRFLQYVSKEYEKLTDRNAIYRSRQIKLPSPHFVVFYNGSQEQPERQELLLSSAYEVEDKEPNLDLKVVVLNINLGKNQHLMEQCQTLKEYMQYVECVRTYSKKQDLEQAVDMAITECIKKGILADFLRNNRAEAKKMSIYEYNEEEVLKLIRKDEREEGREEGMLVGREEGRIAGMLAGRNVGEVYKLVMLVCKKLTKGKDIAEIAEDLEEEVESIESICKIAELTAPDYDKEAICKQLLEQDAILHR